MARSQEKVHVIAIPPAWDLMDLESKYLDALSRVTGFSFLASKLVLNWEKDGNWSAMIFAPIQIQQAPSTQE